MPILIAGGGEKVTLRLVAEHGDRWHSAGDVDTYRHKAGVLAEHCARLGRDPAQIEHMWGLQHGEHEAGDELHAAGVSEFNVKIGGNGEGYDLAPLRELIEWRDRTNAGERSRVHAG